MRILESNAETGEFDADVYIDALRNELDDSSPDISRMKLRSNYKDRHAHMLRKSTKDRDEEYIRYREAERQKAYSQWSERSYKQTSKCVFFKSRRI